MDDKLIVNGGVFYLPNGSSYESFLSQFQKYTTDILCVRDGTESLRYKNTEALPQYLQPEGNNTNEFYYRDMVSDSLYTFFDSQVDAWLKGYKDKSIKSSIVSCISEMTDECIKKPASYTVKVGWGHVTDTDVTVIDTSSDDSSDFADRESLTGREIRISAAMNSGDQTSETMQYT